MGGRFQRGGQPTISFFAFQDIITAVIGILLVVTLLLALHLDDPASRSTDETPASAALAAALEAALRELAAVQTEIAQLQAMNAAADPAALAAESALLREQTAALEEKNRKLRLTSAAMAGDRSGAAVQADLAKSRATLEQQRAAVRILRDQADASREAMAKLEMEAKEREAALVAELDRKNVLRLIPERSTTSKEPVLVLVDGRGVRLQRIDAGETAPVRDLGAFRDALKQFSKLDQYLVYYFKPSASGRFEELTEAGKDAGFEIGYDAIPEEFELEFRSSLPVP